MKRNLLYIAREPQVLNSGGSSVDQRNLRVLREIFGEENVTVEYLPKTTLRSVMLSLLTLSSYGVSRKQEKKILQLQKENHYSLVFIEGSFCGRLVSELTMLRCKIVIHMHNVEAKLYEERLSSEKGIIPFLRYKFIKFNESLSMKHAFAVINLNDRDSADMFEIYNRKADIILPITFPNRHITTDIQKSGNYLLFVGSDFFPNIEGIIWFIKNVAPYINTTLKIIGGCCKNPLVQSTPLPNNVELVGYVDDLSTYYLNASAIIAPIFKGSGMKTKTIEAMSFGKTIIGTDEAFVGIDNPDKIIGAKCNTAKEFIDAINNLDNKTVNVNTLNAFNASYTDEVFKTKLTDFLNSVAKYNSHDYRR